MTQKHYIYTDHCKEMIVFEVKASTILEADILYKIATGKDPAKQLNIGCETKEV